MVLLTIVWLTRFTGTVQFSSTFAGQLEKRWIDCKKEDTLEIPVEDGVSVD